MLPVPKNDRETYIQIRRCGARFADEVVRPKAEELDREERFPREIYQQMGELGLFGITVPSESGGVGLDASLTRSSWRNCRAATRRSRTNAESSN